VTAFHGQRSAIVAPIRLPPPLEAIRREHVENADFGVPAHVTLLFPFVPPARIDVDALARAASAIALTAAFEVSFVDARTFEPGPATEGVVWLPPEPAAPFVSMTEALVAAFPGYLPYEGLHETVIPHLTLANVDVDAPILLAAARAHLPIAQRLEAAALLIEDEVGRWQIGRELPLA
jgi:2'-5' RNA ligase